ncbi:phospholipase D family protein [Geomicrobium sp. JSM 1781026]|uniref:phospholipase D family protein n=1 Tax=Geomicrobium sp. JSM 1781026 TaxID=3344580 RepID=UPI0035BFC697
MDRLRNKPLKRYTAGKISIAFIIVYIIFMGYGIFKPLPEEHLSYNSGFEPVPTAEVLFDYTYVDESGTRQQDHEIFATVEQMIQDAEDFLVVDMFLFNDEYPSELAFPPLSSWLSEQLITKKTTDPDITIIAITDRINSFYGSRTPEHLSSLEDVGIELVWTDMRQMPDSNPIYSGLWRGFIQWFGTPEGGWLPSPFSSEAERVTVRSYLDLLNSKANHRKVILNERSGLVTSANAHDASANHSNVAFYIEGPLVQHLLDTETAVAEMSGSGEAFTGLETNVDYMEQIDGGLQGKVVTEGAIKEEILKSIDEANDGTEIWLGLFYLSDRDVIERLKAAADRQASIRLILDANGEAFGHEKNGVPNRPVAYELEQHSSNIEVRWYNTLGEQYHTKMLYMTDGSTAIVNGGSANFTRRNLDDLNLETNLLFAASAEEPFMQSVDDYFNKLWESEQADYTNDFSEYEEGQTWKYWLYRIQERTGLSAF